MNDDKLDHVNMERAYFSQRLSPKMTKHDLGSKIPQESLPRLEMVPDISTEFSTVSWCRWRHSEGNFSTPCKSVSRAAEQMHFHSFKRNQRIPQFWLPRRKTDSSRARPDWGGVKNLTSIVLTAFGGMIKSVQAVQGWKTPITLRTFN